MELLAKVVWLGTTFARQYESVREVAVEAVAAVAAAFSAVEQGLALEWLEAGRSIFWSQLL